MWPAETWVDPVHAALHPFGASFRLFKIGPGDFVSLHAGVAVRVDDRNNLERLCGHLSRPAVSEKLLSPTSNDNIRY